MCGSKVRKLEIYNNSLTWYNSFFVQFIIYLHVFIHEKMLLIPFCMYPMLGMAADYPCIHLKIKIKNQTQSVCHLTEIKMNFAQILMNNINDIPLVIPVGEVSDPFTVTEGSFNNNLDLYLAYQCGENKTIKLSMEKGLCRKNPVLNAAVVSANNLDATFDAANGLYWDNKPASIVWTLSDV